MEKTHVGNPALRKISLCTSRKESTFKRSMSSCQHGRRIGSRSLLGIWRCSPFFLCARVQVRVKREKVCARERERALLGVLIFFVRLALRVFPLISKKMEKSEHRRRQTLVVKFCERKIFVFFLFFSWLPLSSLGSLALALSSATPNQLFSAFFTPFLRTYPSS
jgi:hypothetical protein